MEDRVFIPIHEIILKSEKESGNLILLKEHALAESSLNQEEISADSRSSDAIALALHQKIPILVELRLLKKTLSLDQLNTLNDFIRTATF